MKKCVLICDDDQDILEVTREILILRGYKVETLNCLTPEEFKEKIEKINPDVILMDLWIPDIGGEQATRELKANAATKGIPVIMFSANNDIEKVAQKSGAEDFLPKPYDIAQLESIIKKNIRVTQTSGV
jgi:DNA-binding response OmpR family regulator